MHQCQSAEDCLIVQGRHNCLSPTAADRLICGMCRLLVLLWLPLLAILVLASCPGEPLFVSPNGASFPDCGGPGTPCRSIQEALLVASAKPDFNSLCLILANGTYAGISNTNISLSSFPSLISHLERIGFIPSPTATPVIDCGFKTPGLLFDAPHVSQASVEQIVFRDCVAPAAVVVTNGTSLTISDCSFDYIDDTVVGVLPQKPMLESDCVVQRGCGIYVFNSTPTSSHVYVSGGTVTIYRTTFYSPPDKFSSLLMSPHASTLHTGRSYKIPRKHTSLISHHARTLVRSRYGGESS